MAWFLDWVIFVRAGEAEWEFGFKVSARAMVAGWRLALTQEQ